MPDDESPRGTFSLGIDIGTTYSAAAIVRSTPSSTSRLSEICALGTIAAQIPTVVLHREDSEVLIGEAAERRSASEPARTAREFKRRLGDPVPIIVGGTPYGAEALMAEVLAAIVEQVTQREGQRPRTIVLTHPANYTDYKRGLLLEAARLAGLDLGQVRLITEPEAAAIAYAEQQHIRAGEIIAVYDFGGGTFDAAIVRDTADGFELLGTPEGMERLGGIDFDQAVLSHVDAVLGGLISGADSSDPLVRAGQARLRDECRTAKEALSTDTDATISVSIPGVQTEVRLTREEFEQMVRPRVVETVKALQRTIASAGLSADDIDRVLLVGGSSRMPIVAQVLRESIGRPVSVDANPKLAIAIGAAFSGAPTAAERVGAGAAPLDTIVTPSVVPRALPAQRRRPLRGRAAAMAMVAGVAVSAAAVYFIVGRGDTDSTTTTPGATVPITASGGTDTDTTDTLATGSSAAQTTNPIVEGVAERLAFNGRDDGAGIPGPALAAGAPATLTGLAIAPDGDTYVVSAGPVVVRIFGDQVAVAADISVAAEAATGITIGSDGTLFVATSAGVVRIIDGIPELILDGRSAGLSPTLGPLALDGGGNLYIADNGTSRIIRRAPDGALTLVAGTGAPAAAGSTPVEGAAAATSEIGFVSGLVVARDGSLLIADASLRRIRAVAPDGNITTVAGGGAIALDTFVGAEVAAGTTARDLSFTSVSGVAVDKEERIYVADGSGKVIVRIARDGEIATWPVAAPPTSGLAISPSGTLLYSDGLALWALAGATGQR